MEIAELAVPWGVIGIGPMPGRTGSYFSDFNRLCVWRPSLIVTLTALGELAARGAERLPTDLASSGLPWLHLPIPDFGTPPRILRDNWPAVSSHLRAQPRLFLHCMGGCGRSGMIALRLMIEAGEAPDAALARLRATRPCAVETKAQLRWANGA